MTRLTAAVDEAAVVAGGRAEHDSDQESDRRRDERDLERDLPAGEQAQELVSSERAVAAEQEERLAVPGVVGDPAEPGDRLARDGVGGVRERFVGPVPEQPFEDRFEDETGEDDEGQPDERRERDRVAAEAPPDDRTPGRRPGERDPLGARCRDF